MKQQLQMWPWDIEEVCELKDEAKLKQSHACSHKVAVARTHLGSPICPRGTKRTFNACWPLQYTRVPVPSHEAPALGACQGEKGTLLARLRARMMMDRATRSGTAQFFCERGLGRAWHRQVEVAREI